jgi:hypothetical protein
MMDKQDKQLMELLEHDIADTAKLLDQGYTAHAICAAKLKNCLMIYRTTLGPGEYEKFLHYVMENALDVPDLKDFKHSLNEKDLGLH